MTKDPSFANEGGFITSFNTNQIVLNSHLIVLKDQSILYLINTSDNDYIFKTCCAFRNKNKKDCSIE
jgi:hypothetical protein